MALPELMENNGSRLPTDYRIRYEHIRFGYNAEKTILNDINLDIKPNSLNAFVGTSGCGKNNITPLVVALC